MLQKFDQRNKEIFIYVNGTLYKRDEAKISVFDSVVQGGDAVWEGLRLYKGRIFMLNRHLERLMHSAHALMFESVPDKPVIIEAIRETLSANAMKDGVHIRLTLTRGEKITSGMDPRLNQKGCGLIVLAEWKAPVYDNQGGIEIITSSIRRNAPSFLDSKIHHNNLLNNILAKIQANVAGADAALMLDERGFLAELNGTNIFIIRKGQLCTPYANACLHGITRGVIMDLADSLQIPAVECNLSLTELYAADGAFATGTMGELTPIIRADGRIIASCRELEVYTRITEAFNALTKSSGIQVV